MPETAQLLVFSGQAQVSLAEDSTSDSRDSTAVCNSLSKQQQFFKAYITSTISLMRNHWERTEFRECTIFFWILRVDVNR